MNAPSDKPLLLDYLASLSDMARVRMLRLLHQSELSVGELAKAMQLPQSTVSRHLKHLHGRRWITKRSEGTASLYRLVEDALEPTARELWTLTRQRIGLTHTLEEDDARLQEVLAERREDSVTFFGRVGSEWDHLRRDLFGEQFTTEALLGLIPADSVVADLGCGTGNAAEFLAPFVRQVIAIDREPSMLEAARKRLDNYTNVEFRSGDMDDLPLSDAEVDAATIVLVLHHLARPDKAIDEVARALRPGGLLLIVDMVAHDRESYQHTMGHQHLGFESAEIEAWAAHAGLVLLHEHRLRPNMDARGPSLFVATMRKPAP